MSKRMAGVIVAYGVILAALGIFTHQIAPASARVTLITGVAGGALCVLWSIVAFAGHRRRTWVVLTMIAVAVTLSLPAVNAWVGAAGVQSVSLPTRLLPTLMFALTVGFLTYVLHAERTPEFYEPGSARRDSPPAANDQGQRPAGGRRP